MIYRTELLANLLQKFISGEDRSEACVDRIGDVLVEFFQDSEIYEELAGPVSMFARGGGKYLLDEQALAKEFAYALRRLREEEFELGRAESECGEI